MSDGVAIITGGGSGIGRESALLLSKRLSVAVCDIDVDNAEETANQVAAAGGSATAWELDVADRAAAQATVAEIAERHGRIDSLVSAAGIVGFTDFLELTEEQWDRMLDVHAKGAFNLTQAVVPYMREHSYGRIVLVSSVGGLSGSVGHSHYAAAKAAQIGFAKALCKEIGPYGVTINVLAPGAVDTPMLRDISPEAHARYADTPAGRIGTATDMANAIEYLTSEGAGFVTGWVLSVNGGMYT